MKVVFVGFGTEHLGISILSAVLKRAGVETALVFHPALFDDYFYFNIPLLAKLFSDEGSLVDAILGHDPDLVAFSVTTPTYPWSLDLARALKRRSPVPIIFGGVHPSAVPAVCLENDCLDYVCVGEGEEALLRLCEALDGGARRPRRPIPNLWWRDEAGTIVSGAPAPFLQDLDSLPYWDKALWEEHFLVGSNYTTMISRGCPYRCSFCFNNYFAKLPGSQPGHYVRRRSVDHVMGELCQMRDRYRLYRIDFQDDIFTHDKPWLRAFLGEYRREINRPFHCLVHPRFLDPESARLLKDAGCEHVQTGLQSADPVYRRQVLRRPESTAELARILEILRDVRIPVKIDHILGLPGEPLSAQAAARELYLAHPPRRIQTFFFVHLPGTELTRRAHAEGRLSDAEMAGIERGKTRVFRHAHLDERQVDETASQLYQRYDLLFRMYPVLPSPLRRWLRAEHLPALSSRAANAVGFLFDLTNALARRDRETFAFAGQYGYQLLRFIGKRLGSLRNLKEGRHAGVGHHHLATPSEDDVS